MDQTELPLEPRYLGVPSTVSKMISTPMVCSVQTMHLSCTDTNTISKWTKTRFHTAHITYEYHRVHLNPFMSLWYVQCKPPSRLALFPNGPNRAPPDPRHLGVPSGTSKMIEMRFHMTHLTLEFHRVPPILFLSEWYVQRKPCTSLASRVALSANRPN
jgi:hypothetical protein